MKSLHFWESCAILKEDISGEKYATEIKPTRGESSASIKVVGGQGGAGGSAVDRMKRNQSVRGGIWLAVNTDAQALHHSSADVKVHIGKRFEAQVSDPEKGREAAEARK